MQLKVVPEDHFDAAAAFEIQVQLHRKPDSVLGTATGSTTVGMHKRLVELHEAGEADFSAAALFQIDEYVGVPAENPRSCRGRIEAQLSRRVNLSPDRVFFPVARNAGEIDRVCRDYEDTIRT